MDQLKEFLGLFRRQHFWFILPVLLILAGYGWWSATGTVSETVSRNVSTIGGYHQAATGIANTTDHPNEEWHEVMDELIASRRANVLAAWQKKWERQGKTFTWPQDAFGPRSASVLKIVEDMRGDGTLRDLSDHSEQYMLTGFTMVCPEAMASLS